MSLQISKNGVYKILKVLLGKYYKLKRFDRFSRYSNVMNDSLIALSFDTGGTILDWHSAFKKAFS